MDQARIVLAHHEAAHAVAHVVLGIAFDYVTISPTEGADGHVKNVPGTLNPVDPDAFDLDDEFDWCLTMVAGPLGEARSWCLLENGDTERIEDYEDFACGANAEGDIGHLTSVLFVPHDLMNSLWTSGRELVASNWDYIVRVATELDERETLSEAEVLRLR